MSEFTPGPWRLMMDEAHPALSSYVLATTDEAEVEVAEVHREADAHLIAAAPDLYEALSAAVDWVNDDISWAEAVEMGKAALAKARGEA